ncbi:hypothetical protein K7432_006800 [Basidiobolus ranarum]|uniref:2,5-diamino-6-ribosylamino-4(3H)-pyrimidinone 5'-phosphate reductase n=1 Tax=Basidiobolus ranarum TaxID=34480 RepID=A0ABR2W118_9FUNG
MSVKISPKLGEFSKTLVPLPEVVEFLNLKLVKVPEDRPYTWSISCSTLDNVISFHEPGATGPEEIGLKHTNTVGNEADFRLLNGCWMFADASLITGQSLRMEEDCMCVPRIPEYLEYRITVLGKPQLPYQIILSYSGDLPKNHLIFQREDVQKIIFTSRLGIFRLSELTLLWKNILIIETPETSDDCLDLNWIFSHLRSHWNIEHLDVSAGGQVISQLIVSKLLDEIRVNFAGHIASLNNTIGIPRPRLFPIDYPMNMANNPHVKYLGVRMIGDQYLFLRGSIEYRH